MPDQSPSAAAQQAVALAQLQAHYAQIPAMTLAPSAGGLYTVWVLWGAVDNRILVAAIVAVIGLSAVRLWLWRHFSRLAPARQADRRWAVLAVGAAAISGLIWGGAAPFLYPPRVAEYEIYLVVLLTLLPIVPVSALAAYMPALYAYFVPCFLPFVVTLALQPGRAEHLTALLLVMMMGAMLTFARRYGRSLAEATLLRMQLAERSQALQQSVRQKSQFIAAASHDLRQPVHAMGLFVASLRALESGPGERGPLVHLDATLRNLRGMLDNMLDMARLDAEAVGPEAQNFALHALLHRLAGEYRPLAAHAGLELRGRWPPEAWACGDPALLERMLRNLLANALKYTPKGGVALLCRRRGDLWCVQVVDTGVGIAADRIKSAFAEFSRLPATGAASVDGLGLGLAIVQRMAGLLGHAVRVRSVVGRGSVFSVELQRAAAGVADASAKSSAAPATSAKSAQGWVIVIDDDPAVATSTADLLRRWGHRADACASANEALAAAAGAAPQLLVVDYRLSGGRSGLEAIDELRQCWDVAVPAIVITGDAALTPIREATAAGHLILHKPVDPQRLRLCVANACAAPIALVEPLTP